MTYEKSPLRPGMTAIAAVLALSSTALFAQSAEVAPADPAAPLIAASPPAADGSSPSAVSNAAGLNIPRIVVNLSDAPQTAIADEPAAKPAAPANTTPSQAAPPLRRASAPHTPVGQEAEAPISLPAQEDITAPPPVVAQPVAEPATVLTPQPVAQAQSSDDVLPIAGAVGFGAVMLLGGAFALVRRKRPVEEPEIEPRDDLLLTEPAPSFGISKTVSPVAAEGPMTSLPESFDLSRYGRHVQAAYRGPTADNPSLSLKNRLKRARFFDQRERIDATPTVAQADIPADKVAIRVEPARVPQRPHQVVSRPINGTKSGFRPAYQR